MAFHQPPDCTFSEIYYKVCNQVGDNGGIEFKRKKNPPQFIYFRIQRQQIYINKKKIPPRPNFFGAKSIDQQYYLVWPY